MSPNMPMPDGPRSPSKERETASNFRSGIPASDFRSSHCVQAEGWVWSACKNACAI